MRFQRTERLIVDATEKLLKSRHIDDISTKDLCEAAGISRNAFYAHYYDKYELIRGMSDRFLTGLAESILSVPEGATYSQSTEHAAMGILQYLDQNRRMLTLLTKNDSFFWLAMQNRLEAIILNIVPAKPSYQLFARYNAGGICSCLKSYYSGDMNLSHTEFITYLSEIARSANSFMLPELEEDKRN